MEYRITNSKGKLFAVFMLVFFSWVFLSAQEMIGGKQVRTGVWEGREVEYLAGEIAVILKGGVGQAEVLPLLQGYGADAPGGILQQQVQVVVAGPGGFQVLFPAEEEALDGGILLEIANGG